MHGDRLGFERLNAASRPSPERGFPVEGADIPERPKIPYPPAFVPSKFPAKKAESGTIQSRDWSNDVGGLPGGYVQPFHIKVGRGWFRNLIQRYRQQYQPIQMLTGTTLPQAVKTSRALPVRPALQFPSYNFAEVDEEELLRRARAKVQSRQQKRGRR